MNSCSRNIIKRKEEKKEAIDIIYRLLIKEPAIIAHCDMLAPPLPPSARLRVDNEVLHDNNTTDWPASVLLLGI